MFIGVGIGLAFGAAFGHFMKARGGTCPLTCNPLGAALLGGLIGLLIASALGRAGGQEAFQSIDHFQELKTNDQLNHLLGWSEKVVLVDFYRPDCPPCRRLAPVLGKLSGEYEDRVEFAKVNVYDSPELPRRFEIRGVPTVILFSRGEEVGSWAGHLDEQAVRQKIESALNKHVPAIKSPEDGEEEETMSKEYDVTFKGKPLTLIGDVPGVDDDAPDATLVDNDLSEFKLSSLKGKVVILATAPSLDTPVCSTQTKKFNDALAQFGESVVVVTVTMDLPFAQKRWCGAEGADNVITLSDHRSAQFGKAYGVLIDELRLLARAVFVVNAEGDVKYVEVVPEMTNEPNYEAALQAVKQVTS